MQQPRRLPTSPAYQQALDWLYGFLDSEKKLPATRADFNLPRTAALLEALENPQQHYPAVVVAGTKGKGSTCAMVESILRAASLKTGLYSSPHLHSFRERLQVDRVPIAQQHLADLVEPLRSAVSQLDPQLGRPSVFELTTALALLCFALEHVDCAVLEVGLGGRFDSVNVVTPLLSIITPISYDHMLVLGNTLAEIAFEKAGIIKPGVPVLTAPQQPEAVAVIEQVARERGAPLFVASSHALRWVAGRDDRPSLTGLPAERDDVDALADLGDGGLSRARQRAELTAGQGAADQLSDIDTAGLLSDSDGLSLRAGSDQHDLAYPVALVPEAIGLLGAFQVENARLACAAALLLRRAGLPLADEAIARGLASVRWPARLEVVGERPLVVVDGAQNGASAERLAEALRSLFRFDRLILILGASADKDLSAIAAALVPHAQTVVLTRSEHPRAAPLELLESAVAPYLGGGPCLRGKTVYEAMEAALREASAADLICATGSLFVAAEARELFGRGERD